MITHTSVYRQFCTICSRKVNQERARLASIRDSSPQPFGFAHHRLYSYLDLHGICNNATFAYTPYAN